MSERFNKRWEPESYGAPLKNRIKKAIKPQGPLKPRLERAVKLVEMQITKLRQTNERFSQRDKAIFAKIVNAYTKHDMPRANMFASELAELRKTEKMIIHATLALEQISLRLQTVSELGDVVSELGPAASVLRAINAGMVKMFPEAERELGEVGALLNGLISEATQTTGMTINFETANEGAQKILTEAAAIAEQKVKEKFPELPVATVETPLAHSNRSRDSTAQTSNQ